MSLVTPVLDPTTNAAMIPTIIAQTAIGRLGEYLNLARTVRKHTDWSRDFTVGETLQIPKRGALVVNDKTVGAEYTPQAPTATNVSVTLDQHPEITIAIDDPTKVLENQDTLMGYAEDAAKALAARIESDVAGLYTGLTLPAVTFDATDEASIRASLIAVRQALVDQSVPVNEAKRLYVDPLTYAEMLKVPSFTEQDKMGTAEGIREGRVIRAYGMEIWESQLVAVTGTTPAEAHHNIAYLPDAFVLAFRSLPEVRMGMGTLTSVVTDPSVGVSLRTMMSHSHLTGAHIITMEALYGVSVVDDRQAVELTYTV